ncbi:ubiquitin carboxyl-terminal hydrolase 35-like [Ornithodoros turicata]|uniref:ubiquitin carboxyl-terminal hydrolase 35-like n=1 Tax=Ornithodoros turicata TaxID=34597 RepID=UPI003139FCDC
MHNLLNGIVKSSRPENVKRELIEKKLIPAASNPMSLKDSEALLEAAWELATNGDSEFTQNGGTQVFTAWCEHHTTALSKFFTQSHLITALTSPSVVRKDRMLTMVTSILLHMQADPSFPKLCGLVQTCCIKVLEESAGTLAVCKAMVDLLERFPQCLPAEEYRGKLCMTITTCITAFPCPTQPQEFKDFLQDVTRICAFMKSVWTSSQAALHRTLETVYIVLTGEGENFSAALAAIVDLLPLSLVSTASSLMRKSGGGTQPLLKASQRLLVCLGWPGAANVHNWVLAALKGLLSTRCFPAIKELFETQICTVLHKVAHPLTRKCSLPVLSYMLLSYQHSPALFHKVAPHIPLLISMLRNEKKGADAVVKKVAELAQTLMYLHSGFPDLYDPILDAIKDIPLLDQEEMQQSVVQHKVDSLSDKYSSGIAGDTLLARREDELVGLVNLGNTCYANSVLQALYMTSRLRNETLRSNFILHQSVLKKLQEVFAFLTLTQRPAFCPESFLESCRPPWFERGEQQDCSEFLRFLIDRSHEEQRNTINESKQTDAEGSQTLVQKVFSGTIRTTYQCLGCNSQSVNKENITDLHLAFPEGSAGGEGKNYHTRSAAKSEQMKMENGDGSDDESTKPLSLKNLLENYFEPENMEGDNRYQCDMCNALMDARRSVELDSAPDHLILTLMRFSYDATTGTRTKILREIQYPQVLSLPSNCGLREEAVYVLYSVVVHSGTSAERGHYYTYARLSSHDPQSPRKSTYRACKNTDPLSKRWYLFNDSRVSPSSFSAFEGLTRRFPRDTAYLLFYKRINSVPTDVESSSGSDDNMLTDDNIDPSLKAVVEADNAKYFEEQEAKCKRARWSPNKGGDNGWDSSGGPSPPPGGCGIGGGGGFGGLGDVPRVVF